MHEAQAQMENKDCAPEFSLHDVSAISDYRIFDALKCRSANSPFSIRQPVLVALAGLIIANAPNRDRDHVEAAKTQNEVDRSFERLSNEIEKSIESKRQDTGCHHGIDNRSSDLCAQWKAADAAAQSANSGEQANTIGWIGVVFGAITMVAAIAAAKFAKDAAEHTKRGADEAQNAVVQAKRSAEISKAALKEQRVTAKRELRAYVGIKEIIAARFVDRDGQVGWKLQAIWHNTGSTPAFEVFSALDWDDFEDGHLPEEFEFTTFSDGAGGVSLAPDRSITSVAPRNLPDWLVSVQELGTPRTYVWGRVEYIDAFGSQQMTECAFRIVVERTQTGVGIQFEPCGFHNGMT